MGDLNTKTIEDVPDGIRFLQTMQVLELLGIGVELQNDLQRILAGILYLGQIPFLGDTDNSYIDPASHSDALKCCDLLGLEQSAFYKNTTVRRIKTSEQEMLVSLSMDQASDGRDALAKDTYDRLFQWLVVAINDSTAAHGMERSDPVHFITLTLLFVRSFILFLFCHLGTLIFFTVVYFIIYIHFFSLISFYSSFSIFPISLISCVQSVEFNLSVLYLLF